MRQMNTLCLNWQLTALPPATSDPALVPSTLAPHSGQHEAQLPPADDARWLPARVPGGVLQALLEAGAIPDPFYAQNETQVAWVGESDWLYRTEFSAETLTPGERAELCFDGLDTFARVWLNGQLILESDNMFVPQRIDVSGLLKSENTLSILFGSAWHAGRELQAAHGGPQPLWNGDASRLHVRKAQYHYGWDWGPKLIDAGPWREIRLERFVARIAEVQPYTSLSDDFRWATVDVRAQLAGNHQGATLRLTLIGPAGETLGEHHAPAAELVERTFVLEEPQLWYPHTLGEQPLYRLVAELLSDGGPLDARDVRFGVRDIQIRQEPVAGQAGRSFTVVVNGQESFIGGANWIPGDSLLGRMTPQRYRAGVAAARAANLGMLRVWGGGIYEDDSFYTACDELGVLVWQDFMFACGLYPAHPAFVESVRQEAVANVLRLRPHPCLAVWTGNNEDYQIAYSQGRYHAELAPEDESAMPARVIYERLLPAVLAEHDPGRYYQPGSPFQGEDPDDVTLGDRHTWDVWGRDARPARDYRELGGRFVSEFGLAAAPHPDTLRSVLPPGEWRWDSPSFLSHLRAEQGLERLQKYAAPYGPLPESLDDFIYVTQLAQSEALDCAYRIWRRGWGVPGGRAVSGALVWQLNDCWPVTSWALIDSAERPKPAYYAVRRALEPLTVSLWPMEGGGAELWALNAHAQARQLTLELCAFAPDGTPLPAERRAASLAPNACTELGIFAPPGEGTVIGARLLDGGGTVLARATLFPESGQARAADPGLHFERVGKRLHVRANRPARGVWLDLPDLPDNMLDLLPGEVRELDAPALPDTFEARFWGGVQQVVLAESLVTGD
ncbi:glycosyl hydrolase 2 galactose-binding domain-containing protein [Deinococcus sp.]|uniref:glycoside hydrolase family 2 protein n=1 Tax=Deinococcus sp. TaxID=47478 RepID=UPI003C7C029E